MAQLKKDELAQYASEHEVAITDEMTMRQIADAIIAADIELFEPSPGKFYKENPKKAQEEAFEHGVGFVLQEKIEGGYVNDPRDPGGETNFGISKRAYPKVDIANLTQDDAKAIYKRDYWDAVNCDDLPVGLAIAMFDCAVNQGCGAAKRLLQRSVGAKTDGIIGPKTLAEVKTHDADYLVTQFLSWRLRRYAHTANAQTYMRGWSVRVLELQKFLQALGAEAS